MKENLLQYWKDYITKFKWNNALIHEPMLSENRVNSIIEVLEIFFPNNYFLGTINKKVQRKDQNWLHLILTSNKSSSIFQLDEIAGLLTYYTSIEQPEKNIFYKSNNNVDNQVFRDNLFEIFINDLLNQNNLKNQINESYLTDKGNKKPLDSFFEFNGEGYLVECRKVYNSKMQKLKRLSWGLEERFLKISEKHPIYPDQLFSGYMGFKVSSIDSKVINEAEENFVKLSKQYFNALNPKATEINIPAPIETDNIIVDFKPIYIRNFEECKKEAENRFNDSISFATKAKNHLQGLIKAHFKVLVSHTSIRSQVRKLISGKFSQHSETKLNKIVAIEIENNTIDNELGNSLPLTEEDFKSKEMLSLIRDNRSLLVTFKNVSDKGISYKFGFLSNDKFDKKLSRILHQPKFKRFSA
jgi:hypothetical protein